MSQSLLVLDGILFASICVVVYWLNRNGCLDTYIPVLEAWVGNVLHKLVQYYDPRRPSKSDEAFIADMWSALHEVRERNALNTRTVIDLPEAEGKDEFTEIEDFVNEASTLRAVSRQLKGLIDECEAHLVERERRLTYRQYTSLADVSDKLKEHLHEVMERMKQHKVPL